MTRRKAMEFFYESPQSKKEWIQSKVPNQFLTNTDSNVTRTTFQQGRKIL